GACEQKEEPSVYNARVQEAIDSLTTKPSFAILENGLNFNEQSCILIWEGIFYGMGYISSDLQISDPEELKSFLTPYKENLFIRNLVNGYAARFPEKVKLFSSLMTQSSH
ncbi:MAG: exonuclease domain-containing protein, partial [Chitinophagaceae bacterium]